MAEQDQRAAVIAAARSYVGTKYHHHGMLKGVGVDCATLLALVYPEAGVKPSIVVQPYSSQWHLHSADPLYVKALIANGFREVEWGEPGDIVLFYQAKQFAHGGIITGLDPLRLVHAHLPSRRVVEGFISEFATLVGEPQKFFSAW